MKKLLLVFVLLVSGCATDGYSPGAPVKVDEYPSMCVACERAEGPYDWGRYD
jgi:hypothetical protein